MVRLKEDGSYKFVGLLGFQFHYGSVKSVFFMYNSLYLLQFQFHYGSVKRLSAFAAGDMLTVFQFHYGSVKRTRELYRKRIKDYFNSTMVRLKGCSSRPCTAS